MSVNDGGPAFPTTKPLDGWGDPNKGMTLRDWFAGLVLEGMNANPELMQVVTAAYVKDASALDKVAAKSYEVADAMLRAREKKT